jgi:hypothetical protein
VELHRQLDADRQPTGAQSWSIGCKGTQTGAGIRDSVGTPVWPRSLYRQQLLDRLGPDAVQALASRSKLV